MLQCSDRDINEITICLFAQANYYITIVIIVQACCNPAIHTEITNNGPAGFHRIDQ